MVLFEMDVVRFIQIYIVQLGMGIVVVFIGLLILKRSTKRLNQIFATFYLLVAAATITNVIYASLTIRWVVKALHVLTVILFWYATLYILVFCLIVYKSETVITVKRNNVIALIYFVLLLVMAPIAYLMDGITINETTDWKPVWNLAFAVYAFLLISVYIVIPLIYLLIKTYRTFEDDELKRRWKFFALGLFPYFLDLYLITFSNFINDPTFRLITALVGLSIYASAFLLYYGVIRQIEKK